LDDKINFIITHTIAFTAQNHQKSRRGHSMPPRSRKLNFSGKFFFRQQKK
jgi:hypothetical protein